METEENQQLKMDSPGESEQKRGRGREYDVKESQKKKIEEER